jgi:hypothetical protein
MCPHIRSLLSGIDSSPSDDSQWPVAEPRSFRLPRMLYHDGCFFEGHGHS